MTASPTQLSHPKYRPDIDGLRAIAVLAVVVFHAFPSSLRGGFIGVDIFFVISGFLISTIIFENVQKDTFSFAEFYSRRIRRIFPALLLVITATFIFGFFILSVDEFSQLGKLVAAGTGFVANLVLWNEAGYFDAATKTKPLLHLWSLGIEEQFYIIWPLLLLFAWKRKLNLLILTIVILIASFTFNVSEIRSDPVATFYSPLTRFWELLCGSLLAWITVFKSSSLDSFKSRINDFLTSFTFINKKADKNLLANVLSSSGLFLFLFGFWQITKKSHFPGAWAVIPVLGTVLIIMAGTDAWINRKILSSKIAIWFGLISFPLYLWHWPLLSYGRIYYDKTPPSGFRWIAILVAILLAWLTVKFIEKPFRNSEQKTQLKVTYLCCLAISIGISGYAVYKTDFSQFQIFKKFSITRKGFEHAYGPSLAWYQGRNSWLFLGNKYEDNVAKMKLEITPSDDTINEIYESFEKIVNTGSKFNTKVAFIMGPNKESIYPEYLPDALVPSADKYSHYFLNALKNIPNLTVYDPTKDLLLSKEKEGLLYWKTDTHWNNKGAFVAFSGFSKLLSLPVPQVEFKQGSVHKGDLIDISKLEKLPLSPEDNWDTIWKNKQVWVEKDVANEHETSFGVSTVVTNESPLLNKYVWVVGDSFISALKPYFNTIFKEIRYIGHWSEKLDGLPEELAKADRKPDMIIIVRVERSF